MTSELVTNTYRHTNGPAPSASPLSPTDVCASASGTVTRVSLPPSARRPATVSRSHRPTARAGVGCASCRSTPTAGAAGPLEDGLLERDAGKLLWFEVGG
ncbi:hypothetical protein GCM10023084_73700 [Streptomyces lacrimifluminis]|uniref:Uncharacterized protein n=1 Tax=Streptomyces lacrimifluminis TaxID=1500077 RepID=A0A917P6Q6_9ACTN|nr:hypothetical protein GCM10012282_71780 [Streptomyces lacrimifluminis]